MKNEKMQSALPCSSITGTSVLNKSMDTIGNIEDLMIDLETGEVSYAVLAVDTGFLNMSSKYFAIPLEEFDFKPSSKEAMLSVDKKKLENSPGFDKDNWPVGPQPEFVEEVFKYYGREYPRRSEGGNRDKQSPRKGESGTADRDFNERGGYMDKTSVSEKPHHADVDPNKNIL